MNIDFNIIACTGQVSESEKEVYQSQVNDAMSKYKLEYTEWYEALTAEEQKVGFSITMVVS